MRPRPCGEDRTSLPARECGSTGILDPPPDPMGCFGDGLFGGCRPKGPGEQALSLRASPVDVPEAGAASSVLQPRRDAPPETGLLGDRYLPIGARSRSRGRRPRPKAKGVTCGSGCPEDGGRKNPAAIVCRSRIRLTRRRGVAVFPGTRQRSLFSAPDASAFSTADSRRATTFCGRQIFASRYCAYAWQSIGDCRVGPGLPRPAAPL